MIAAALLVTLLLLAAPAWARPCGVERWAAKTGGDAAALHVNL